MRQLHAALLALLFGLASSSCSGSRASVQEGSSEEGAARSRSADAKVALVLEDLEARAEVERALLRRGLQVVDATPLHGATHDLAPLMLGALDAPVPAWADAELTNDWEKGAAACRERAGPGPYNVQHSEAFLCGRELATALWQRWLDREKPTLVLVLRVARDRKQGLSEVRGALYPPNAGSMRVLGHRGSYDQAPKLAAQVTEALLEGEGESKARTVIRKLPVAPTAEDDELFAGSVRTFDGVPIPEGCAASLPSSLEVTPPNAPLAKTLMKRWTKTVASHPNQGEPLACALRVALTPLPSELLAATSMRSMLAQLRCGEERINARTLTPTARYKGAHDALTAKLIEKILQTRCAATR